MRKFFGVIVGCMLLVGFTSPAGAMSRYDATDDYCKRGTFDVGGFAVVCVDDYPCGVIVSKTYTGECWWEHRS